jgi:protease-4
MGSGVGGPQPPRRRTKNAITAVIIIAVLAGLALISIVGLGLLVSLMSPSETGPSLALGDKVGVVMVEGVIMAGGRASPVFGGPSGSRAIMSDLRAAGRDRDVKAVVLYINSPGGSAASSQSIYQEVKNLAKRKPVIAVMDDVAASGGYYVACAADKIVANGSTLTGSIGVIWSGITFYELMNNLGVEDFTIASGRYKDSGSAWRPLRPDERQLFENLVGDVYNQFVDAVTEGRDMERTKVLEVADGRVFTGRQALELGLIDDLGSYYDAVALAAKEAGIEGEAKTKIIGGSGGLFGQMIGTRGLFPLPWQRVGLDLNGPLLIEPQAYHTLMLQNLPRW